MSNGVFIWLALDNLNFVIVFLGLSDVLQEQISKYRMVFEKACKQVLYVPYSILNTIMHLSALFCNEQFAVVVFCCTPYLSFYM